MSMMSLVQIQPAALLGFEVLRARTLYRKTNLRAMLENGLIDVGPVIPEDQPVFHFESAKEDEDEDLEDDYEPFPNPEEE